MEPCLGFRKDLWVDAGIILLYNVCSDVIIGRPWPSGAGRLPSNRKTTATHHIFQLFSVLPLVDLGWRLV